MNEDERKDFDNPNAMESFVSPSVFGVRISCDYFPNSSNGRELDEVRKKLIRAELRSNYSVHDIGEILGESALASDFKREYLSVINIKKTMAIADLAVANGLVLLLNNFSFDDFYERVGYVVSIGWAARAFFRALRTRGAENFVRRYFK